MILTTLVLCCLLQEGLFSMAQRTPSLAPTVEMKDGRMMPALALGTYLGYDVNGPVMSNSKKFRHFVTQAIDVGYRHIDTASIYMTEEEVGEAINIKISQGVITRQDMFVTTKLWNTHHKREQVLEAIKDSLNKTQLEYFDLYLMHWPIGLNSDFTFSDVDYMETWRGMEDVLRLGLAKSIGLSNFNMEQLKRVLDECQIKPVAFQIEIHPQLIQRELIDFCKSKGIVVMGYSPLGSLVSRYGVEFPGPKMTDPFLVSLSRQYNKTVPQVVLRWAIDRGVVPLPKTFNFVHLVENFNVFDFRLSDGDIEEINKYNSGTRFTLPSFWQEHQYYPFDKIENPVADPFRAASV